MYILAVETRVVTCFHPCVLETLYLRTCKDQALVFIIVAETKVILYVVAGVQQLPF